MSLEIIGYFCLMLTGVSLGLLGAGGAILGVPVLVYLLAVPPVRATGYSLVLVGLTALVGAVQYVRRGYAHPRMAVTFGAPTSEVDECISVSDSRLGFVGEPCGPTSCGRGQSSSSRPSWSTNRMPALMRLTASTWSATPMVWKIRMTSSSWCTARGSAPWTGRWR